jgi:hypothetical protein
LHKHTLTDALIALILRAVPTVAAMEFELNGGGADRLPYLRVTQQENEVVVVRGEWSLFSECASKK